MGFRDYNSGLDHCCYDCKERYEACHDSCEKYIKAKASWNEKKQKIRDEKGKARIYDGYKADRIIKENNKRGNNRGNYVFKRSK